MKMIYVAIAVIIIGGFVYFFAMGNPNARASKNTTLNVRQDDTAHQDEDNPYAGLRNMALTITADQLQLTIPTDQTSMAL